MSIVTLIITLLWASFLKVSRACDSASGCPDLDQLEAEPDCPCEGCCPQMMPMMPPMMPPMMSPMAMMMMPIMMPMMMIASMAPYAVAMKKMKMAKKAKKKMAKKEYKSGMMTVMSRMMAGQMPQPQDFVTDGYSYFEFPQLQGTVDIPSLIPGPLDLSIKDYKYLYKYMNGKMHPEGYAAKKRKMKKFWKKSKTCYDCHD